MIKKTIQLFVPTGNTGATFNYSFTILLTSRNNDFGFFDVYPDTGVTGTSIVTGTTTVTGTSSSRLVELQKFVVSNDLGTKYKTSTSPSIDGLDLTKSVTGGTGTKYLTYYIGNISYVDTTLAGSTATTTTFTFQSLGLSDSNNFSNYAIYKDESKEGVVENPFINSDVNIIRQEISVFENSLRLRSIRRLSELTFYGGGQFYTIYNNS